jgi:hypothetical protein
MRSLVVTALMLTSMSAPAFAHHRAHHEHRRALMTRHHSHRYAGHGMPWCGVYMRHVFGSADARLNVAGNWASVGSNAGGPQLGAVVVWPHHVGVIRGGPDSNGQWLVESGNDGGAVRTRYRSIRGAIAFRYVGGGGFGMTEASRLVHSTARRYRTSRLDIDTTAAEPQGYTQVARNWTGESQRRCAGEGATTGGR